MKKILSTFTAFIVLTTLFAGCDSDEAPQEAAPKKQMVTVQSLSESQKYVERISYPATVISDQEATVIAKAAGTVSETFFELGQSVIAGQRLLTLDANADNPLKTSYDNAVNAAQNTALSSNAQIQSAQIGVTQAKASLELAQKNYDNILLSTAQDLQQAEIARDQALRSQENVGNTTDQAIKSAELAYENSKILSSQAELNLSNRKLLLEQNTNDTKTNTEIALRSFVDSTKVIINSINTITAFFDPDHIYIIDYLLGSLDYKTYNTARDLFQKVWSSLIIYERTVFPDLGTKITTTVDLITQTKAMVDATKQMFEKTTPNGSLPLDPVAPGGKSLNGYKSMLSGYQAQINSILMQAKASEQAFVNLDINNKTTLDALQKSFDLAKEQEAIAAQNLNSVRATNTSQNDQSSFGAASAEAQFAATKIKLESQVNGARAQVEINTAQYESALSGLKNVQALQSNQVDATRGQLDLAEIGVANLTPTVPVSGKVVQKLVNVGDAVSPGQQLATISATDILKIQFYVDASYIPFLARGQEVSISYGSGQKVRGAIANISPQADPLTKRFLIEALPEVSLFGAEASTLLVGTVVSVELELTQKPRNSGALIVPLSAMTVSPSESFFYIVVDGKAQKVAVEILAVEGERAEIRAELPDNARIIIEGNKLLQDGAEVEIQEPEATDASITPAL